MSDDGPPQFQLAVTSALARLEQRADDQREHNARLSAGIIEIRDQVMLANGRVRSLEESRASAKAVLGFSRVVLASGVVVVSAAVSVLARLIH